MLDCKPIDTHMYSNTKLLADTRELSEFLGRYRSLVCKLNYLTVTRPDLSFAVNVVCQFLDVRRTSHWTVVIRILRYLKKAPRRGLSHQNHKNIQIECYTDVGWVGCLNNHL